MGKLCGVYITSRRNYAKQATKYATAKHGGDLILITVQGVVGSGGLDEDLISTRMIDIGIHGLFDRDVNTKESLPSFLNIVLPKSINLIAYYVKPTFQTIEYIKLFYEYFHKAVNKVYYRRNSNEFLEINSFELE